MREQIDRVKNWKQFLKEQNEYKIFRDEQLERIETIPQNVNLVDYIKSQLIQKNGEYYYEDDYSKLRKINFDFEGNDILIYPDGKYKLLPNEIMKPNVFFFDIRYPNEINQMSEHSNPSPVPFGYRQLVSNNYGKRWVDGNDAFIPVKKVESTSQKYTREDLIQICIDAVVPFKKWNDRDSYVAQVNVASIYKGLTGGVPYTYTIENRTINICFQKPTPEQKSKFEYLPIDSRDDYFEWYYKENGDDYTPEMFNGYGIEWNTNYLCGYLPIPERLKEADGEDWY